MFCGLSWIRSAEFVAGEESKKRALYRVCPRERVDDNDIPVVDTLQVTSQYLLSRFCCLEGRKELKNAEKFNIEFSFSYISIFSMTDNLKLQ
jgi:hypothetical protein